MQEVLGLDLGEGVHLKSRLLRRHRRHGILDAPRNRAGAVEAIDAWVGRQGVLWWMEAGTRWEVPVRIERVWHPVPAVEVRFGGAPAKAERRREPRYVVHWPGSWRLPEETAETATVIYDLSRQGARFSVLRPLLPGTTVVLTIHFPHTGWAAARGKVVRLAPAGTGREPRGFEVAVEFEAGSAIPAPP
jgi:hypothetical protein